MDRKVPKKNQKTKKFLLLIIPVVFLMILLLYSITRKRTTNVSKNEVSIRNVKKGQFEDMLFLNGKIEPLHSILINVIEGGAVKKIFVEDGSMITKGQKLLQVFNPNTELGYLQQETAMIEQINNLQNLKISLQNQELNLEKELIQIEYDYIEAKQQFQVDTALYKSEILSKRDFEKSTENFKYQSKRQDIIQNSVLQEKKARVAQIYGINQSLIQMRQSLNTLKENKENFIVMASASGRLSSFDLTIGQSINSGENVGKIDILDGYKFVVKVDEFYFSKITTGLKGSIEFNDTKHEVVVKKVLPEVVNGQFTIEMVFVNDIPNDLRMGMSFNIKLYLSENIESLLIPKGKFYSETSGNWIFVLINENKAEKRNITLGRENPLFYEVTNGLMEGEKVIISDYSEFKNNDMLKIND